MWTDKIFDPVTQKKLKRQKRNQTQEKLSTSKAADGGRDRDRDIFSLWSIHGKTVHGSEPSDSV